MGYYIYDNAAYPLRYWLIVGYRNLEAEEMECINMHRLEWPIKVLALQTQDLGGAVLEEHHHMLLQNVTIEVSSACWDWDADAGVVRGNRGPSDRHTCAQIEGDVAS